MRSRKTLQLCPAGPLRKLLSELMCTSEEEPTDLPFFERLRSRTALVVRSNRFEYATGLVILLNLIAIGFEAELSLEGDEFRSSFQVLERVFWSLRNTRSITFKGISVGSKRH